MAEQKLDVRVSESGTATVVSTLEKLEKKLGDVEKAQQAETATTEKAVATLGKMSEGLAAFFDRQSSKMAVIEKAAGLLGKFNLAFELVGKAIKAGEYILDNYINKVKDLAPALDGVNKRLATQVSLINDLRNAGKDLAAAAGLDESQLTPAETQAARRLKAQEDELRERAAKLNDEIEAAQTRAGRNLGGLGGGTLVMGEDYEKAAADLERVGFALEGVRLQREKLAADAKRREKGNGRAPGGGAGGGGGGTGIDVDGPTPSFKGGDPLELLAGIGDLGGSLGDIDELMDDIFVSGQPEAMAFADAMALVVEQAEALKGAFDPIAESWKNAGETALQAGADMRRAAATSVVAAALQGKSIIKALGAVLTAKSQEYLVESLDWGLKAAGFALFGNPAAGAAAAIAAGYLAASGVAAGAGALFGGGGGGGGGRGGGGGGTAPAVGATGPRAPAQADAGGPLTVNVTIDGMAISTRDSIAAGLIEGLQHAANTPGLRGRLKRAVPRDQA